MPYKYQSVTFFFSGTEAEQEEAISLKAEEMGFNRFSKYEFGSRWKRPDGTNMMDDYFQNGDKRLHVICANPLERDTEHAKNKLLQINND